MRTIKLAVTLLLAAALTGCNKKSVSADSADGLQQKLQELAGKNATNCGRVKSVAEDNVKPASDCAMQASQSKKPFFVAYDLPGLTIGIAGASDGKLYTVQSQTSPAPASDQQNAQQPGSGPPQVTVNPCPSELRIAASGRVTCYAVGSFGVSSNGANPHGGGMMMNPHGGMTMPPSGTPSPHGGSMMTEPMPNTHGSGNSGSATKNEKPTQKDASKQ